MSNLGVVMFTSIAYSSVMYYCTPAVITLVKKGIITSLSDDVVSKCIGS